MLKYIFRAISLLIAVAFVSVMTSGCSGSGDQTVVEKKVLLEDTVWEGEVLVKGDVEVPAGVTLTVMPGAVIKFAKVEPFGVTKLSEDKLNHFPRSEIIVNGAILAQGTPEQRIVFTSAESNPEAGDWGAVNMLMSVGNIIQYCDFSYAHTAVHSHSSHAVVVNNNFSHNGVAIGQKNVKETDLKSVLPMMYNTITENGGGILFGGGTDPSIFNNEIKNNSFFGIYVKKAGKATIRYNNISNNAKGVIVFATKDILLRDNNIENNTDYNLSMLDGQEADIDARMNWWGSTDEQEIKATIHDKASDKALGQVDFSAYLENPVIIVGNL